MKGCVLLVEPLKGTVGATGVLVGVGTLPVLEVEGGLGERVKRVLGLGLLGNKGLVIIIVLLLLLGLLLSLGSGGSSGLGLLLLLWWGNELESLLGPLNLAPDVLHGGVVEDGLGVTDDVGELRAELSVEDDGGSTEDDRGDRDIRKGDTLSDEVCTGSKVLLKGLKTADGTLNKGGVDRLVVWERVPAKLGDEGNICVDLRVGKGDPLVDKGSILGVRWQKGGVGREGSDYTEIEVSNQSDISMTTGESESG